MKYLRGFIIVLFLSICNCLLGQNRNYFQTVVDLVMSDKCFEAIEYMEQHKSIIKQSEETMALYKFKMYDFMNQPDSAVYYLENILKDYPQVYGGKGTAAEAYFLNILLGLYHKTGNYLKELELYKAIEEGMKSSLSCKEDVTLRDAQLNVIMNAIQSLQNYIDTPKPKVISFSNSETTTIPIIKSDSLVSISIKCNGTDLQTWVDTGAAAHLFMTKKMANKCEIHVTRNQTDSINVNGKNVLGKFAIVDSLCIGDFLFTDIPVCIIEHDNFLFNYPDSIISNADNLVRYNSTFGLSEVILGLPLLKMLGSVECNWKQKKMSLKLKSAIPLSEEKPNIFLSQEALYGHFGVNGNSYVGLLDSGARHIGFSVTPSFYQLHKDSMLLSPDEKTVKMLGIGAYSLNESYRFVENPEIYFNNKVLNLKKEEVWVWTNKQKYLYRDGLIGLPVLKKLGNRVTFDFVNMRLTAEG